MEQANTNNFFSAYANMSAHTSLFYKIRALKTATQLAQQFVYSTALVPSFRLEIEMYTDLILIIRYWIEMKYAQQNPMQSLLTQMLEDIRQTMHFCFFLRHRGICLPHIVRAVEDFIDGIYRL